MTASELIDALGGTAKVAALLDVRMSRVSNWRKFGRLPSNFYFRLRDITQEREIDLPEDLFREKSEEAA